MFAAVYLPSLPSRTADAHARLMVVAREFSPRVERIRDDLLTLDVAGLERWFDAPRGLGEAVRRSAADRGLAAHVAVAATRTTAMLCARGRAGLTVVLAGEESARLAPLPLDVLWTVGSWQWAVGSNKKNSKIKTSVSSETSVVNCLAATLRRWGLRTLGDLARLPTVELSERLGQAGTFWQRLARGEDLQPLVPVLPDERFEVSLDLDWPIDQLEPLSFVLGRLFDSFCARLEQADRAVAVLHVHLDLVGRQRFTRMLQLPAPMRDARTLRTLALLDLESNPPPAPIDRVTVAADVVEGRVLQFSLLARALPAERLSTLLARLSALMGSDRVGAPALMDSYRPGAFAMAPFEASSATAGAERATSRFFNAEGASACGCCDERSRGATASGGGAPRALNNVVRRFRHPIPARVDVHQGRPVRVTSAHRHLHGGYVKVCAGPWRSSGDWWVTIEAPHSPQLPSLPWDRDEWEVTLRDDATYVVFCDRARGNWFIDGILD